MTYLDKNADFGRKHERKSCPQRAPSLATGHGVAVWPLKREKIKPIEEKMLSSMEFGVIYSEYSLTGRPRQKENGPVMGKKITPSTE